MTETDPGRTTRDAAKKRIAEYESDPVEAKRMREDYRDELTSTDEVPVPEGEEPE